MQKLDVSQFAVEAGVGEKNTVSSGPDNGGNNNIAARFWQCARHGSTKQAFDFAVSLVSFGTQRLEPVVSSAGGMNIAGHGNEGMLTTGQGQNGPFDTNQFIYLYNEDIWGPQLDRVKPTPITMISVWSCHTGAGPDGAELLYRMAVRCGRAVRAGTGFLYSTPDKMWWENGSVWQVATPSNKPPPIAAPSPHFIGASSMFEINGQDRTFSDIGSIEIERCVFDQTVGARKALSGEPATAAAGMLFTSPDLDMKGISNSGLITAIVKLTFKSGEAIVFDVYNDRLAVERTGETAYYLNAQFRTFYDLLR